MGSSAMFLHHHHHHDVPAAAKKRDFSWSSSSSSPSPAFLYNQHLSGDWNPAMWNWDSRRFTANAQPHLQPVLEPETPRDMDEDAETLTLRLGGGLFDEEQPPPPPQLPPQPVARPNKRVRSGSPGNHPMCQVDDCKVLLTEAKDYHRRHKVCELHSKTAKALVANQMQRFCQQCSRYPSLESLPPLRLRCSIGFASESTYPRRFHKSHF